MFGSDELTIVGTLLLFTQASGTLPAYESFLFMCSLRSWKLRGVALHVHVRSSVFDVAFMSALKSVAYIHTTVYIGYIHTTVYIGYIHTTVYIK